MTTPNQITACATSSLQGVYVPEVRMYNETPHEKYGLMAIRYMIKGKTRDRKTAIATAREHIKNIKGFSPSAAREYLESVATVVHR